MNANEDRVMESQHMQFCQLKLVATPTGYQVRRIQPSHTMYLNEFDYWTKYEDRAFTFAEYAGAKYAFTDQINSPQTNGNRINSPEADADEESFTSVHNAEPIL